MNDALREFMTGCVRGLTDGDLGRLIGVLESTRGRERFGAGLTTAVMVTVPGGNVSISWQAALELAKAEAARRKANREKVAAR